MGYSSLVGQDNDEVYIEIKRYYKLIMKKFGKHCIIIYLMLLKQLIKKNFNFMKTLWCKVRLFLILVPYFKKCNFKI